MLPLIVIMSQEGVGFKVWSLRLTVHGIIKFSGKLSRYCLIPANQPRHNIRFHCQVRQTTAKAMADIF